MTSILLLGDQTAEQYPLLRKVVLRNKNALVTAFLENVSVVLREEIGKLPSTQRQSIPDFLTVSDLVEPYYAKALKIPAIESSLLTIAQLGHYIGYVH